MRVIRQRPAPMAGTLVQLPTPGVHLYVSGEQRRIPGGTAPRKPGQRKVLST